MIRITLGLLFGALLSPYVSAQSCDPNLDLRHTALPPSAKNDIVAAVARDATKELAKEFARLPSDSPSPHEIALGSCTSFPKLAQGGRVILVTQGPDYPTDAPISFIDSFWLFQQVGTHAVLILAGINFYGPASATYKNGMLDIQTSTQEALRSSDVQVEIYRFNGKRYLPLHCYLATFDDNGDEQDGPKQPCRK